MKSSLPYLLILFLVACNDRTSDKHVVKVVGKKDTAAFKPPQPNPYASVDVSPIDISYFPDDYPIQKMSGHTNEPPVMRVIYSRPQKQGRVIFGNLVKYGEPWRLGANEASELEFFQPVTIQNKKIAKGRYIIYSIPGERTWKLILNSNVYSWGLKPKKEKDLYEFEVPVQISDKKIEYFTMVFEKAIDGGANLLIAWDNVELRLPIKF